MTPAEWKTREADREASERREERRERFEPESLAQAIERVKGDEVKRERDKRLALLADQLSGLRIVAADTRWRGSYLGRLGEACDKLAQECKEEMDKIRSEANGPVKA